MFFMSLSDYVTKLANTIDAPKQNLKTSLVFGNLL